MSRAAVHAAGRRFSAQAALAAEWLQKATPARRAEFEAQERSVVAAADEVAGALRDFRLGRTKPPAVIRICERGEALASKLLEELGYQDAHPIKAT